MVTSYSLLLTSREFAGEGGGGPGTDGLRQQRTRLVHGLDNNLHVPVRSFVKPGVKYANYHINQQLDITA